MYPLSYLLLVLAWRGDNRMARYLLAFPVFGAGVSIYHLLIENNVIHEPPACVIGGAIGCSTKWINEFGYMTIPTLALTGFLLLIGFLVLASTGSAEETATLPTHAER
jgi:disulfide bond formation protein DsbB